MKFHRLFSITFGLGYFIEIFPHPCQYINNYAWPILNSEKQITKLLVSPNSSLSTWFNTTCTSYGLWKFTRPAVGQVSCVGFLFIFYLISKEWLLFNTWSPTRPSPNQKALHYFQWKWRSWECTSLGIHELFSYHQGLWRAVPDSGNTNLLGSTDFVWVQVVTLLALC